MRKDDLVVEPPRVFISFAGDDWSRFVEGLGNRLRQHGVDAWVAYWEIKAGDSLVRKIFEEGLKKADKVIIVLSEKSVAKPWVLEELDIATVRKIEDQISLIPVKIDDCGVPESLRATKRITIRNLEDYEAEFQELLRAIYGASPRPPLGAIPAWARAEPLVFSGLNQVDALVLELMCESAMKTGHLYVKSEDLREPARQADITSEALNVAIGRLDAYRHVKGTRTINGEYVAAEIAASAFDAYARAVFPGYDDYRRRLIAEYSEIPYNGLYRGAWPPPVPIAIHNAVVRGLERQGLVKVKWAWGGGPMISGVSPLLSDLLDD